MAFFHCVGKTPSSRDFFNIRDRGMATSLEHNLSMAIEIPSKPFALLLFSLWMMSMIFSVLNCKSERRMLVSRLRVGRLLGVSRGRHCSAK